MHQFVPLYWMQTCYSPILKNKTKILNPASISWAHCIEFCFFPLLSLLLSGLVTNDLQITKFNHQFSIFIILHLAAAVDPDDHSLFLKINFFFWLPRYLDHFWGFFFSLSVNGNPFFELLRPKPLESFDSSFTGHIWSAGKFVGSTLKLYPLLRILPMLLGIKFSQWSIRS